MNYIHFVTKQELTLRSNEISFYKMEIYRFNPGLVGGHCLLLIPIIFHL